MKKKIFFNLKRPYVFVPMSADFLHHGHINILVKSNKFGNIVVGLMTNAGIKSYKKRLPFFDYNQRKDKPDRSHPHKKRNPEANTLIAIF